VTPDPGSPYPELLARLDRWADDARARNPDVIPCRSGCTACCHGPFDISVADAMLLRSAARRLPGPVRNGVARRAAALAARIRALAPDWGPPWDIADIGDDRFDAISEALVDVPCPLLDAEGACLAYDSRPMVCRWMGLGMLTGDGESVANACPIQDRFPDFAALPPQPFDLAGFTDFETPCLEDAAEALLGDATLAGYETTIALALDALHLRRTP
jgi:Fe-S-cluster containining protein